MQTPTSAARAFIFVSGMPNHHIAWYAVARFVLSWQIRWLQRNGIAVTLVTDSVGAIIVPRDHLASGQLDDVHVISSRQLDCVVSPRELNTEYALLMPGPMLLDCDSAWILKKHKASGQEATILRQRHGAHLPVAYCCSSRHLIAQWANLRQSIPSYVKQPSAGLPLALRMSKLPSVRGELVRSGDPDELRRLKRAWAVCAPRAGLVELPGSAGVYHVPSAPPTIAGTARIRGPILFEEGVTIGDFVSVGNWVLLERATTLERSAWVETATIGSDATIGTGGCVYACIVAPNATVVAGQPVLKGYLEAYDDMPRLLDSFEAYRKPARSYLITKRLIDVTIALIAFAVLSPLLVFGMFMCLVTQGLPIFFRHERVGIFGTSFDVFKLRTMRRNSQHMVHLQELEASDRFKLTNDPRVTKVGRMLRKASIDELPQLLNVLSGHMSVVGPRPIVPKETVRFGIYTRDLVSVKPGMTGLWQVKGRSSTTYARRIMLDVQYADQCSAWLDLAILLRTVPAVLFLRGSE